MESLYKYIILIRYILFKESKKTAITKFEYLSGLAFLLVCLRFSAQGANAQALGSNGIWMSKAEIDKLPVTGAPWDKYEKNLNKVSGIC